MSLVYVLHYLNCSILYRIGRVCVCVCVMLLPSIDFMGC